MKAPARISAVEWALVALFLALALVAALATVGPRLTP
jgi:Flp pilus assembly pilin Flp